MKISILFIFFFFAICSFGQKDNLLIYQKSFVTELKLWASSFKNFKLSDFTQFGKQNFDNNLEYDFNYYKEFLSTYKPIITYSPDGREFIDIYSYQLNLEKKGSYYYANPDIDQTIFLCNPKAKYWNRIYFTTTDFKWIDEVVWISSTKFILAGSIKSTDSKIAPLIIIGDTNTQILEQYLDKNQNCFQTTKGYISPKLKRIDIRNL